MNNIRKFTILPAAVILMVFAGFKAANPGKKDVLMQLIMQSLVSNHYSSQDVNDEFSTQVYDLYLKRLDYSKRFLTQADVNKLKKYRLKIDDDVRNGEQEFFTEAVNLITRRTKEAQKYYQAILSEPFDFNLSENIEQDPDKIIYAGSEMELEERWRKNLKYSVMTRLYDNMKQQENNEEEDKEEKSFEELEKSAREKVLKMHDDWFKRLLRQDENDHLATYINAIANVYDPHTSYYPPKDKANFDIGMTGRLEGIGATLQEKEGYIRIVRIVPGSPSWKQGELEADDIILKVGQAKEEAVDVVDMPLDEAVQMIRGKKGTEVRLTVKKVDGNVKVIPIIRDVVVLDETYAKSAILEAPGSDDKIGYIKLPKFYADFTRSGGPNCSSDVKKEIAKLKAEGVTGIVFDLRNNGGGSLYDVVKMSGLFIEDGPIVQVKSKGMPAEVLSDRDSKVHWDGPLVVMVNNFSASASEIMAAAIQDYERGIIMGSTSTYGKGTVQRFYDLDRMIRDNLAMKPLGAMKLTTQKFYRINGGATQLKGVTPDIILPDNYSYIETGERDIDYSMPWDEIEPASYSPYNSRWNLKKLKAKSEARVRSNPVFQKVEANAKRLKKQRDDSENSLKYDSYKSDREALKTEADKYKDLMVTIDDLEAYATIADKPVIEADSSKIARYEDWFKNIKKDAYLGEALNVIQDMN